MEIRHYGKEMPGNVLQAAQVVSWKFIERKYSASKIKSYDVEIYNNEIKTIRNSISSLFNRSQSVAS